MTGLPLKFRIVRPEKPAKGSQAIASPAAALTSAFFDTVQILFRPFDAWKWFELAVVCLLLGGGTATAALNWGLGSLSSVESVHSFIEAGRFLMARHVWLAGVAVGLALVAGVVMLYLRARFRFILVDSIAKSEVRMGSAWKENRALGESYFFWLLAALAGFAGTLTFLAVLGFPFFARFAGSAAPSPAASALLTFLFILLGAFGALGALAVMLTDDLAVPLMYAERLNLAAAWRRLARTMRPELKSLAGYAVLRLAASLLIGAAVLFFLFPTLLAVFFAIVVGGAAIKISLGFLGIAWGWNPLTTVLAAVTFVALSAVLFLILSVAGMPEVVFIQDFGMRYLAGRFASVAAFWPASRGQTGGANDTIKPS